jgi:hypothetical protein
VRRSLAPPALAHRQPGIAGITVPPCQITVEGRPEVTDTADPWGPYRATIEDHVDTCIDYLSRLRRSLAGEIAPNRDYFAERIVELEVDQSFGSIGDCFDCDDAGALLWAA